VRGAEGFNEYLGAVHIQLEEKYLLFAIVIAVGVETFGGRYSPVMT